MEKSVEQVLAEEGSLVMVGQGKSMRPMLYPARNMVRLVPCDKPSALYDVVLIRRDATHYILHRIVRARPDGKFNLRGDASLLPEEGIRQDEILGTLESFVRHPEKKGKDGQPHWTSVTNPWYRLYARAIVVLAPLVHVAMRVKRRIYRMQVRLSR